MSSFCCCSFTIMPTKKKIFKFKNVEKKKQKTKINPIVNQSLPDGCRWVSASLLLCAGAWAHAPNQNDGDEAKWWRLYSIQMRSTSLPPVPPHSPLYSAHTSIFNTFSNFQFEWVSPLSAHDLNRASILNISPLSFSIVYYTTTTSGLGFVAGQKVAFSFSFTYIRTVYSTYTSFPGLLPSLFLPIPGRESRAENRHCCVAVKLIKCWPNARLRRPQYDEPND